MRETAVLIIFPAIFICSLVLRSKGLGGRPRAFLAAILIVGLIATGLLLFSGPGSGEKTTLDSIGENLLTAVAVVVTVISWSIFRGVDFLVANPDVFVVSVGIIAAALGGFLMVVLFGGLDSSRKTSRLLLALFLALGLIPFFYLMYWLITPQSPQSQGILGQVPSVMEFLIARGVSVLNFSVANAVASRRLIIAVTVAIAAAVSIRGKCSPGTVLIIAATGLALLAQSYIVSGSFPEAIYLYLSAGLVLAGGAFARRPVEDLRGPPSSLWKFVVILTLAASLLLGLYRLEAYPIRYHPDEAMGGFRLLDAALNWNTATSASEAAELIRDDPNTAFAWKYWDPDSRPNPRTPISTHLTYLCLKVFPVNFVTLRASVVLVGALTVLFLYLVLRIMFGPASAVLGAFLLATSSWQIALNRIHLPYSATQLYALICFYLFWKAQGKAWPIFYPLLGLALAFSNTFYPTFKMVYLVLPVFILYRSTAERGYLKRQSPGLLLAAATFLLILSARQIDPIGQLFFYQGVGADTVAHHRDYLSPSEGILEAGGESVLAARSFIRNIFDPAPFEVRRRNYIERGIYFNIFILPFAVMGFFWCLFNFKRSGHSFLGIWLILALLPNLVTGGGEVDRRATLITAPMMAAAGVFLNLVWRETVWRLSSGISLRRVAAGLAGAGLGFLMLSSSAAEYFYPYYHRYPNVLREFARFKEVDQFLERALDNDHMVYFLNRDTNNYMPHHEVQWYLLVRLFSGSEGRFVKRSYQADSRQRIDRGMLRSQAGEEGFVVFGPAAEKDFIFRLSKIHPRSKLFSFRWEGRPPFEIIALVVESRGGDPNADLSE